MAGFFDEGSGRGSARTPRQPTYPSPFPTGTTPSPGATSPGASTTDWTQQFPQWQSQYGSVDQVPTSDPFFNSPGYISWLNASHPEYSGKPATGTTTPQPNWNWLSGYDTSKLQDPTHTSAKYQIGRTLARFNPSGGFADPVIAALNALGLGHFAGSGDRLSLTGVTNAGRQAGLDTHDFQGDFIQNWTGTDPTDHSGARWTYDAYQDPATVAAADPFAAMMQSFSAPSATSAPPDLSWLGPLMTSFAQTSQPQAPIVIPMPQSQSGTPNPTFQGGYVQPGFADSSRYPVVDATNLLSLALPKLMQTPNASNDPLIQQILRLIGGRR